MRTLSHWHCSEKHGRKLSTLTVCGKERQVVDKILHNITLLAKWVSSGWGDVTNPFISKMQWLMIALRKCVPKKINMDEVVNHETDQFSHECPQYPKPWRHLPIYCGETLYVVYDFHLQIYYNLVMERHDCNRKILKAAEEKGGGEREGGGRGDRPKKQEEENRKKEVEGKSDKRNKGREGKGKEGKEVKKHCRDIL